MGIQRTEREEEWGGIDLSSKERGKKEGQQGSHQNSKREDNRGRSRQKVPGGLDAEWEEEWGTGKPWVTSSSCHKSSVVRELQQRL